VTSISADTVIIGGGLHGGSAAVHLASRGVSCIVLEKDHVGRHASGVNAGGVRTLGRALPEIPIAKSAQGIWHNIHDLVDDDCGFVPSGQVEVAETETELAELQNRSQQIRKLGFSHEEIIDQKTLRELLPAASDRCIGGMVVYGDGHANPYRTTCAFRYKAEALGVQFFEGVAATQIERHAGLWQISTSHGQFEAPTLINCAGAWGGQVAEMLGERVPVKAWAPMLMITERMAPFVKPVVVAQGRALSFKQFDNGTVLIGGGHCGKADLQSNETQLDTAGLTANARAAISIFPIMQKVTIVRCWTGIEGRMPDEIPVIGPSKRENAFHCFGFSGHGFQLAPAVGSIIADLVTTGASKLPIEPFHIDRF
jgi:sarcosine oxidase subunit beta